MKGLVGVIIVNYKTADLTISCLRSLSIERRACSFDVIIVDNDSQDGSFEKINSAILLEGWDSWVTVMASDHNGGFAYGNNVAIRKFLSNKRVPEYFYLLNPDTVVHEGAVVSLVSFMQEKPAVGVAGSRIEDECGRPLHSAFKFHTCLSELNRGFSLGVLTKLLKRWVSDQVISDTAVRTDWVSGASMMIRRDVFEQVGLLDEAYFMYYEETDFCLQVNRAGLECWYVPASRVVHFVGQSSGITNEKMTKRMPAYWFNSRRRYFLKNFGVIHACCADLFWLIGFIIWKSRNLIQRKEDKNPPNLFKDMLFNSVFFRGGKIKPIKNQ